MTRTTKRARRQLSILMLAATVLLPALPVQAERTGISKPSEERFEIRRYKAAIAPYITGGVITGDAADLIDDTGRQTVYGIGARFDYRPLYHFVTGVKVEALFAKVAESEMSKIRMLSVAYSTLVPLWPERRATPFVRAEAGLGSINQTSLDDGGAGSHFFWRLGIGERIFDGPTRATHIEAYYKVIYTEGYDGSVSLSGPTVPFNVTHFGMEFAISFRLF